MTRQRASAKTAVSRRKRILAYLEARPLEWVSFSELSERCKIEKKHIKYYLGQLYDEDKVQRNVTRVGSVKSSFYMHRGAQPESSKYEGGYYERRVEQMGAEFLVHQDAAFAKLIGDRRYEDVPRIRPVRVAVMQREAEVAWASPLAAA